MTEILFYMKEEEKMKWMRRAGIAALSVLLLLTGTGAGALGGKENTKDLHIEEAFAGTEGTMVLKSLKNDKGIRKLEPGSFACFCHEGISYLVLSGPGENDW
jgi:hypothetical protein